MGKVSLIGCLLFCCCVTYNSASPINKSRKSKRVYKEAEYDIALDDIPKQYFVKPDEYQQYERQFNVIRELGEELKCKLHGSCNGEKREGIVKEREKNVIGTKKSLSSMMNMPQDEGNDPRQSVSAQDTLRSPLSPELEQEQLSHFGPDPRYSQQSNAAKFGQQPQMDLKVPSPGGASAESDVPVGMAQTGIAPVPSNTFLQMQHQQNDQTIQDAIQSKLSFMDQANRERPSMGMGEQVNTGFPVKPQSRDENPGDSVGGPHGLANTESSSVSENDILNAEGIQPNEMHDLHNFLKNSNEMNNHANSNAEMTDGKFSDFSGPAPDSPPGSDSGPNSGPLPTGFNENGLENIEKTNVDFGSHPHIENQEGGFGRQNTERAPFRPGTPEVPVLNNLLGGPTPDNPGPDAPPNVQFVEQNAKDMMQTNSDYRVPDSAFSNLWKDYMMSTQSQLGQDDPSANSRDEIGNPKLKKRTNQLHRWKKSDVGHLTTSVKQHMKDLIPKPKKFLFLPVNVVKNLLMQASKKSKPEKLKNVKGDTKSLKTKSKKSTKTPLYVTEKNGKKFLVVNPDESENLIKGFANVDSHYMSFAIPDDGRQQFPTAAPFQYGMRSSMDTPHFGPYNRNSRSFPFLSGRVNSNGIFQGYMAVPIITNINSPSFSRFSEFSRGFSAFVNGGYNNPVVSSPFYNIPGGIYRNNYVIGYPMDTAQNSFGNNYFGNTFMYGPAYRANLHRRHNTFERMSENQPLLFGHFYRDPGYNPSEGENNAFPSVSNGRGTTSQNGFNNVDDQEIMNEIHMSGEDRFDPKIFSSASRGTEVSTEQSDEHEIADEQQNLSDEQQRETTEGYAPEPVETEEASKRDRTPFVYTKEHVGFGPITVEAKTANSKMNDLDDE